jgi:hypothetical protein
VGFCIGLASVAQASLLGNSIDVQYVWPSVGSVYQDLGTITATAIPQTVTFQPYFNVTISDAMIVVDGSNYGGSYSGSFNGEYLTDLSVPAFPDYVLDPSSVLTGGIPSITIVGNVLEIDFHGLTFGPGEQLVLDFNPSAVPEPSTLALLGLGLGGMIAIGWRHYRA